MWKPHNVVCLPTPSEIREMTFEVQFSSPESSNPNVTGKFVFSLKTKQQEFRVEKTKERKRVI